jgi:hypothetical protein
MLYATGEPTGNLGIGGGRAPKGGALCTDLMSGFVRWLPPLSRGHWCGHRQEALGKINAETDT